jgi:hypothetical protein
MSGKPVKPSAGGSWICDTGLNGNVLLDETTKIKISRLCHSMYGTLRKTSPAAQRV